MFLARYNKPYRCKSDTPFLSLFLILRIKMARSNKRVAKTKTSLKNYYKAFFTRKNFKNNSPPPKKILFFLILKRGRIKTELYIIQSLKICTTFYTLCPKQALECISRSIFFYWTQKPFFFPAETAKIECVLKLTFKNYK